MAGDLEPRDVSVPPLLRLCLDALTRHRDDVEPSAEVRARAASAGGSFWFTGFEAADDPKVLSPLPLPVDVKISTLQRLRVSGELSDEALLLLLDAGHTALNLSACRQITGDALHFLPHLCPSLQTLDLSWCCQLRADDVEPLSSLSGISLRGCHRLPADALAALLRGSPSLRAARLPDTDSLEVLRALPKGLLVLELSGVVLGTAAVRALPIACPQLRALVVATKELGYLQKHCDEDRQAYDTWDAAAGAHCQWGVYAQAVRTTLA